MQVRTVSVDSNNPKGKGMYSIVPLVGDMLPVCSGFSDANFHKNRQGARCAVTGKCMRGSQISLIVG